MGKGKRVVGAAANSRQRGGGSGAPPLHHCSGRRHAMWQRLLCLCMVMLQ